MPKSGSGVRRSTGTRAHGALSSLGSSHLFFSFSSFFHSSCLFLNLHTSLNTYSPAQACSITINISCSITRASRHLRCSGSTCNTPAGLNSASLLLVLARLTKYAVGLSENQQSVLIKHWQCKQLLLSWNGDVSGTQERGRTTSGRHLFFLR